jgi:hypothetical protein
MYFQIVKYLYRTRRTELNTNVHMYEFYEFKFILSHLFAAIIERQVTALTDY